MLLFLSRHAFASLRFHFFFRLAALVSNGVQTSSVKVSILSIFSHFMIDRLTNEPRLQIVDIYYPIRSVITNFCTKCTLLNVKPICSRIWRIFWMFKQFLLKFLQLNHRQNILMNWSFILIKNEFFLRWTRSLSTNFFFRLIQKYERIVRVNYFNFLKKANSLNLFWISRKWCHNLFGRSFWLHLSRSNRSCFI